MARSIISLPNCSVGANSAEADREEVVLTCATEFFENFHVILRK